MYSRLLFWFCAFVLAIGVSSKRSPSTSLARRVDVLLNVTQAEQTFNAVIEALIDQDPLMSQYKSEALSLLQRFFSFQSLRPEIIKIYTDLYTLSDINGMIAFYSTPLGKKMVTKEPQAELRLLGVIKTKLQSQMPQILAWINEKLGVTSDDLQINGLAALMGR